MNKSKDFSPRSFVYGFGAAALIAFLIVIIIPNSKNNFADGQLTSLIDLSSFEPQGISVQKEAGKLKITNSEFSCQYYKYKCDFPAKISFRVSSIECDTLRINFIESGTFSHLYLMHLREEGCWRVGRYDVISGERIEAGKVLVFDGIFSCQIGKKRSHIITGAGHDQRIDYGISGMGGIHVWLSKGSVTFAKNLSPD